MSNPNHIFFYGTLMCPQVYQAVTEEQLVAQPAVLKGYQVFSLKNRVYPGIIHEATSEVPGLLVKVNDQLIRRLDYFEGSEYERKALSVFSNQNKSIEAWVYVLKDSHLHILDTPTWNYDHFLQSNLEEYLR